MLEKYTLQSEHKNNMSYGAERVLACFYPLVVVSSVICCITSAVAWSHWRYVLNACPETNCGCYLYAHSTHTSFEGGYIAYCYYATYGLMLPLLFCVVLGGYHVYRVCFGSARKNSGTTTIKQRCGDTIVVTTESEIPDNNFLSHYYWLPTSIIACIMALYTLIYASIFTGGFDATCKQYRESLLKEIQGVGNISAVIQSRLACSAIFDFMDNLVESISSERRKYGRINSSICFHLTLVFSWFAVVGWIAIATINIIQTKRSKSLKI